MIVRWGLDGLADVVPGEYLLIASERWGERPAAARWTEVPSERIDDAAALARDCVVALGGGSAIDLGKAVSARAGVPLVNRTTRRMMLTPDGELYLEHARRILDEIDAPDAVLPTNFI